MGFLKKVGEWVRAKDRQAGDSMDDKNAVAFSENDLEDLRKELQKAIGNKGQIKGTIITFEEEIKDKKKTVKDGKAKVENLLEAEKEELALKVAAKIEALQTEVETAEAALKAQKELYTRQTANCDSLRGRIDSCESELKMMKTMEDVTKSNQALADVNVDGGKSASARFEERRKKMTAKMHASTALADETAANDPSALDNEVAEALGEGKGQSVLADIKAKMGK